MILAPPQPARHVRVGKWRQVRVGGGELQSGIRHPREQSGGIWMRLVGRQLGRLPVPMLMGVVVMPLPLLGRVPVSLLGRVAQGLHLDLVRCLDSRVGCVFLIGPRWGICARGDDRCRQLQGGGGEVGEGGGDNWHGQAAGAPRS